MAWGDKGTLFVGSFGLGNVYAITDNGGKKEVKTILKASICRPASPSATARSTSSQPTS